MGCVRSKKETGSKVTPLEVTRDEVTPMATENRKVNIRVKSIDLREVKPDFSNGFKTP